MDGRRIFDEIISNQYEPMNPTKVTHSTSIGTSGVLLAKWGKRPFPVEALCCRGRGAVEALVGAPLSTSLSLSVAANDVTIAYDATAKRGRLL